LSLLAEEQASNLAKLFLISLSLSQSVSFASISSFLAQLGRRGLSSKLSALQPHFLMELDAKRNALSFHGKLFLH
jgi:hypothetical protein